MTRESKFQGVFCETLEHEDCMSNVRVLDLTRDSLCCAVNPKFIAFINKRGGCSFMVIPVNKTGRIDKNYPLVEAHKAPCLEIAWNPFNDNIIASCSEDRTVKIWAIPRNGLTRNLTEPVIILSEHQEKVNTITWHPSANNILLTSGGDNAIIMWNVGTGKAFRKNFRHPDRVKSIDFNHNGSQFVTTCEDKKIRIFDSHTGKILREGVGHEGENQQKAIFVQFGLILTTGFTKQYERIFALRSAENLSNPIFEEKLDISNGVIFPFYDEDTGLLYLVGKGDRAIRYYEITHEAPFVHYINTYTSNEPHRIVGFQSKRGICPGKNEINRIYTLTPKGNVNVLQFIVPKKLEEFQQDLYPDTRSTKPALTANEFIKGRYSHPNRQPVTAAKDFSFILGCCEFSSREV